MLFQSFKRKGQVLNLCWLYFFLNQLQKLISQILIDSSTSLGFIKLLSRSVQLNCSSLNCLEESNISLQSAINSKLHHLKDHKFQQCFLLSMEKKDLKNIVEKTRVREVQEEEDLILWKSRIQSFWPLFEFYSFLWNELLGCDVVKRVENIISAVLKGFSILNLRSFSFSFFLQNFPLSQLYLLLPSCRTVELFIVFTEVKASIIQTLIEVFRCHFLTSLLKFRTASSQFCQFLLKSWDYNSLSYLCVGVAHHYANYFSSVDVTKNALNKWMSQSSCFLDSLYGSLKANQIRVYFVFFFFISKKLLLKLILTSYEEISFSPQGNRDAQSVEHSLQGIVAPTMSPIGISIRDENIAIPHLLKWIFLINKFIQRCKDSHSSSFSLKLLGKLVEHIEERDVAEVNRLKKTLELPQGNYTSSIEINNLADLLASLMPLQSQQKLWLGQFLNLQTLCSWCERCGGLFCAQPSDDSIENGS